MWARRQGFPTHSNGNTMAHSSSLGLFQLLSDESKAVMVKKEPRNILGPMVLLDDHYRMKGTAGHPDHCSFLPCPRMLGSQQTPWSWQELWEQWAWSPSLTDEEQVCATTQCASLYGG